MEARTILREGRITPSEVNSPLIEAGPQDDEEAAVFVHGDHGSSREWEDLLSRIGQFGRAVALDMPGFGYADKPEAHENTVEGYAGRLDGVLAELGIRRAHLVLHDSGGPWGLQWACEHPEALASATLINISAISGNLWHHAVRTLRPLRRPALVLWGARDPYLPVRYAERQQEFFRDARIVVFEEGGHCPFDDDPEAVADEVVLFLRRSLVTRRQPGERRIT